MLNNSTNNIHPPRERERESKLKFPRFLFTILASLIAGLLVAGIVMAWTNPTANPPSGGGALYYYNGSVGVATTTPSGIFHVATSSITGIIVSSSGNVGIGTTNPNREQDQIVYIHDFLLISLLQIHGII